MGSSLYLDQVPARWMKQAYPSMLPLTAWILDLQLRHKELDVWLVDFQVIELPLFNILIHHFVSILLFFRHLLQFGLEDFLVHKLFSLPSCRQRQEERNCLLIEWHCRSKSPRKLAKKSRIIILNIFIIEIQILKKFFIRAAPREGVYIHGLYLEGARWDPNLGVLAEAKLKELHPPMPVIYVKVDFKNIYRHTLLQTYFI